MKDYFKGKCEIVKDLLPLYSDRSCSLVTSEYIGAHLVTCKSCRNYLATIKNNRVTEKAFGEIPDSSPDFEKLIAKIRRHKIVTRSAFAAVTVGLLALNISLWLTND